MAGHARLLAGLAVVVAGGLAGAAGYALEQATGESSPAALPAPTASPTASPTPTQTPTETPTPTPVLSPTPTATAVPTATPRTTATPTTRFYAYPRPSKTYARLALSASVNPRTGTVGQLFALSAATSDGDGTIYVTSVDWGDGTVGAGEANPGACPAYPSPTAQPGGYRPQPDRRNLRFTHRYRQAGSYTVTVEVRSLNADCRPYGPAQEQATARFAGPDAIVVVGS
ncbi:MAG: hypothetical protein JWM22_1122 [Frankiales bacterium]|nr:hypothetical protein [Frankiales bacterium]